MKIIILFNIYYEGIDKIDRIFVFFNVFMS